MTYGISPQGFKPKRLLDIIRDKKKRAEELFADLVPPEDIVDTSDSSLLGRLIALDSPSDAELWEVAQQIYWAFDPNSAMGVALDNLTALSGILPRIRAAYSTASIEVEGDRGTNLEAGQQVSAPSTGDTFVTTQLVGLNTAFARGVDVAVIDVLDETDYTISYTVSSVDYEVKWTSGVGATDADILNGLASEITSHHPLLTARVELDTIKVNSVEAFSTITFANSTSLQVVKVRKVVGVRATEHGVIELPVGVIVNIDTPVLGWDSVTNITPAAGGRLRETDEGLRLRFRNTKFERASNILDSLYSAILSVNGVTEVSILENDDAVEDANGLPPHSFMPIVLGGNGADIVQAIWRNKLTGISSHGNNVAQTFDVQGFPHNIKFERPSPVTIYIEMTLTTNPDFPPFGDEDIKVALVNYFRDNFGVGDDVIYSRLYTAINSVKGHQVDSLYIGTSPSPTDNSNIPIAFNQIASLSPNNIIVNR